MQVRTPTTELYGLPWYACVVPVLSVVEMPRIMACLLRNDGGLCGCALAVVGPLLSPGCSAILCPGRISSAPHATLHEESLGFGRVRYALRHSDVPTARRLVG